MRPQHPWSGNSRTLAIWLLAAAIPPAAMLVWLGVQLFQQDRALLAQREGERRAGVARLAVATLDSALGDAERRVADGAVPDGCVRLAFSSSGVAAAPPDRMAWLPAPRPMRAANSGAFVALEALEFRGDLNQALAGYGKETESRDPAVRAGALLRAARVYRQQQRWDDALRTYGRLAGIRDVAIAESPADLQARRAICSVLQASGRTAALVRAARALETDVLSGGWALDRTSWDLTASDIERWTGHAVAVDTERRQFSEVAAELWSQRQQGLWPGREGSGRRLVALNGTAIVAVWSSRGGLIEALAIPGAVVRTWLGRATATSTGAGDRLSLLAPSGSVVAGAPPATDGSAIRMPASETGLPWTVVLTPGSSPTLAADLASRQQLLLLGLAAILMLLVVASSFLWRVVHRELAMVRQQQEFVAAVSHEFRTPLTSLRHVTELLQESDDVPADRRRAFYESLGRNTDRLQRLVESLLDFSRMESGRKSYDLQPLDASDLAKRVVEEFEQEAASRGVNVRLEVCGEAGIKVRADAAALTNAIWNLLDNAVKYSPDAPAVQVSVTRRHSDVVIAVRDQGMGSPTQERQQVFQRFVRGRHAARLGIKGTGLGLAIVAHIVSAHGGTIELESGENTGSTFRVVLPGQD